MAHTPGLETKKPRLDHHGACLRITQIVAQGDHAQAQPLSVAHMLMREGFDCEVATSALRSKGWYAEVRYPDRDTVVIAVDSKHFEPESDVPDTLHWTGAVRVPQQSH